MTVIIGQTGSKYAHVLSKDDSKESAVMHKTLGFLGAKIHSADCQQGTKNGSNKGAI